MATRYELALKALKCQVPDSLAEMKSAISFRPPYTLPFNNFKNIKFFEMGHYCIKSLNQTVSNKRQFQVKSLISLNLHILFYAEAYTICLNLTVLRSVVASNAYTLFKTLQNVIS